MFEFFARLLDTSGFAAHWESGPGWTHEPQLGWLHIVSDLAIFTAYAASLLLLALFVRGRNKPFPRVFWLFLAFLFACAMVHLVEATVFWWPWYRLSGLIKLGAAVIAWATVIALVPIVPKASTLRSADELEREVQRRTRELRRANEALCKSEERKRMFLANALDAFVSIDAAGVIVDWNRQAEVTFGWSAEEALGRELADTIIPYCYRDAHRDGLNRYLATREARLLNRRIEITALHRDGHEMPIELSITPVQVGNRFYFDAFVRDITERKNAELALREGQQRLRLALEGGRMGTWQWNVQTGEVIWDERQCNLLGIEPVETAVVETFFDRVHPDDVSEIRRILDSALQDGDDYEHEFRTILSDGQVRWLAAKGTVLRDQNGQPLEMIGLNFDITARKQNEQQLLRLNEQLERKVQQRTARLEAANRELEAFSYSVSHDLRAPLRHIGGFVDLLRAKSAEKMDATCQRYLDIIADSAQRAGQLVDELLAFSRMSRTDLKQEWVDMNKLVSQVKSDPEIATAGRDIRWVVNQLPSVQGDPALLRLVWINLLSNAVKYTLTRETAEITIDAQQKEDDTVFEVRDNGVGFDMQFAGKLFGVFQRLHLREDFEGTGIGLANVRRIIERHGGRTWADGSVDAGATFYFSLPKATCHTEDEFRPKPR
jgi:PAS domain S-box-containing protein